MGWASVVSIAITGAVGIAGVAGTILAARIASKSASDRENKAERRRVYAACLTALYDIVGPETELAQAASGTDETRLKNAITSFEERYHAMMAAMVEASLIASDEVRKLLSQVIAAYPTTPTAYIREGKMDAAKKQFNALNNQLSSAMRADLRETS